MGINIAGQIVKFQVNFQVHREVVQYEGSWIHTDLKQYIRITCYNSSSPSYFYYFLKIILWRAATD